MTTDPLAVLRYFLEHCPEHLAAVEEACTRAEVDAVRSCSPSTHAANRFDLIRHRSLPAAVVSNNSDQAVIAFLERHGWAEFVAVLSCRRPHNVAHLKPDPFLVQRALYSLRVDATEAFFLGDTTSDVWAGAARRRTRPLLGQGPRASAPRAHPRWGDGAREPRRP